MVSDGEFSVLDIFSGAGGLSEGFFRNGFKFISHIDKDKDSSMTLQTRSIYHALSMDGMVDVYQNYINGHIDREHFVEENKQLSENISGGVINMEFAYMNRDRMLLEIDKCKRKINENKIDVIIGGPPCQAYSVVGRARDPQRMKNDDRNFLYRHYLDLLKMFKPSVFVFENVPGMRSARGGDIYSVFKSRAEELGYYVEGKLLNAKDFFVLQNRERLIVLGWRSEYDLEYPSFGSPEHDYLVSSLLDDLPPLNPGEGKEYPQQYLRPPSEYLNRTKIRSDNDVLIQHRARNHNNRDRSIYRTVIDTWNAEHRRVKYDELPEELKTHKNRNSFKDRFKVIEGDLKYSHTILAHLSQDGHYFIHPDINQARSITVREAARLQSFPDDFKFEGSRKSQFRQVGNAVPPLMAEEIGKKIKTMLRNI